MSAPRAGRERSDDVVHDLRRLTIALHLFGAEFAARHHMHATDVRALVALLDTVRSGEPASPGALATALGLSSASTTALLDRMERADLVNRTRDEGDRRRVALSVTAHAERLGAEFFGELIGGVLAVADDYTAAELDLIRGFLTKVTATVESARAG
ncbi:MarR family transcriptional regulator [Gordonia sp. ABSL1-1]|uniref:MarR family winged helix-turn-helix transcriptional regulator n=1 Tax=Gordonia sp. ABSL1-1 TaxID=3053923 RepID=UPI0025747B63|nr:MarR family transcriptional regulator [Gordonia sp. ABSL1-1]MDL9936812.1 MarR family transcriptional regulator [Gordonia sp. ABSL1-1]